MKNHMTPSDVEIEIHGKTYRGSYRIEGNLLTVSTALGTKTTQLGGLPSDFLAKQLLREMAQEGKA